MNTQNPVPIHVPESDSEDTISMVIAGDCIVPDGTADQPIGQELRERISRADLSLVNLEAPVTDEPPALSKSGPNKHTAPNSAGLLASAGFDGVTLANNHIMDYGPRGLRETLQACVDADIAHTGAGRTAGDAFDPMVQRIRNCDISIVNLCEREFGEATDDSAGTACLGNPMADAEIGAACENSDIVIAIVHGGTEYVPFPPPHLQNRFRHMIDLGVDLVVGHHPHVPQGWERYDDGLIVYSLGNFLFHQSKRPSTQWGVMLDVQFGDGQVQEAELMVTSQQNGRVQAVGSKATEDYHGYLDRLAGITGNREALDAHWQSQAAKVFQLRYTDWLATGVGTNLRQWTSNPSRLLHPGGRWDTDKRGPELLVLLNLIRNESHRSVMQTALEVETGIVPDRRTPEIEATVDELLRHTDDRYPNGHEPTVEQALEKVIDRVLPTELQS